MHKDFNTFSAQLRKPDGSNTQSPPSPSSDADPSTRSSTPIQVARRRILQTFVPTKVFIPADINTFPRIASSTESPIGFLIPGRGARGVPLKDILEGDALEKIAWRDMFLFHRVEYGEIDLYLSWPGYVGHERFKRVDLYENGERMPLKVLASAVAKFVSEYIQSCKSLRCLDRYAKWRISDENIKLEDVTIVSLINTYSRVWQPELAIEKSG